MPQDPKVAAIRAAMPAVTACAYLNTGTYGPQATISVAALTERVTHDLHRGRARVSDYMASRHIPGEVRQRLGRVLGATEDETAITRGTSDGMNYAIWGIEWHEGDELVTTNLEHIGGLGAAYVLAERFGVRVRFADCGEGEHTLDAIRGELSPRTKAIGLSHVAWANGYVLPVGDVAEMAHGAGALVIVDGAQSAGAIAVDVKALGVDAYAAPGQKWLCGPGGTGGLYVATSALDRMRSSFAAYGTFASSDEQGLHVSHPNARRFELGFGNTALLFGLHAGLGWLLEEVGLDWVYARTRALADHTRQALAEVEGVTVTTPVGTGSGLTQFRFEGWEPMAVVEELGARDVVLRSVHDALRVSTGFYNDESDIERLVAALREVRKLEPHASGWVFE